MNLWNFHPTAFILLPLLPLVRSFTLTNIPSVIPVSEPFTVDWTSDPTVDPVNITVIVYDATRTPACSASDISHYELAAMAKDVSSGEGQISFTAPHSGKYILCAFSVSNSLDPRSANGQSLFNSTVVPATLVAQTVTVTASPTATNTNSVTNSAPQRNPHDGAIIGGTLGGFIALLIAIILALFWFGRYRIVSVSRYGQKSLSREDIIESERRAVENFTHGGGYPVRRVQPDGQGWTASDERPPSYDSVHGAQE
ncbi:hypothetical protein E1B28_005328 [Marasmius oreades]|uniref:Uncharacterized protein n=1 Tax=Marasmius oreades TaxID=181124 RepID=A0A9P8AE10_9AGAR|nr:uncharacterized protein E1B28_005328 [Marasmius oreades]KAG7098023.1 hypothetical protein E1B28_005328 [Marasmius oreades]